MRTENGHKVAKLTRQQFLRHLRDALNHLQEPDYLRQSPLVALFGVTNRFDTPLALQSILIKAIESLEPSPDEPPRSRAWRIYDALFYRYVQQFSPREVGDQLGISGRQLRREQHTAREALAFQLWKQYDLEAKLCEDADVQAEADTSTSKELAWLKDVPPEATDPNQTLPAVVDLVRPLAAEHGVCLDVMVTDVLPDLAVHPIALRQALLNLLGVAIHWASLPASSGGQVRISARPLRWVVEVEIQGSIPLSSPHPLSNNDSFSLDTARQLASLCGGRLTLSTEQGTFDASIVFPAIGQAPVLAIDDHASALQLLQRYTVNTRYRLVGTRDPEQVLSLAEKHSPQIIVLDVMMPQMDGWEVLARLRQHPHTAHIPIVVCTIMAQEELALSLGASAFIRKPVTRPAFLAALDRQVALMGSESR